MQFDRDDLVEDKDELESLRIRDAHESKEHTELVDVTFSNGGSGGVSPDSPSRSSRRLRIRLVARSWAAHGHTHTHACHSCQTHAIGRFRCECKRKKPLDSFVNACTDSTCSTRRRRERDNDHLARCTGTSGIHSALAVHTEGGLD
jgi:hypothetical protein